MLFFLLIAAVGLAIVLYRGPLDATGYAIGLVALALAFLVSNAIKIADQWEKTLVLRLGKFHEMKGPGLFFIIPIIDSVPYWIDTRVITSSFKAEKTLTKDTVPVDVDAVLFWKVIDPQESGVKCR